MKFKFPLCLFILISLIRCSTKIEHHNNVVGIDSTLHKNQENKDSISTIVKIRTNFLLDDLLMIESEEALIKKFGKQNVARGVHQSGEVEEAWPMSVLFQSTKNEVRFIWRDTIDFKNLSEILHNGNINDNYVSDWKTSEGIALGTTIPELEKLNGEPFTFYAFGWNYGGDVNWTNPERHERGVYVSLRIPDEQTIQGLDMQESDERILSNSDLAKQANPVVAYIELRKNDHP